jgi:signal peptidase I
MDCFDRVRPTLQARVESLLALGFVLLLATVGLLKSFVAFPVRVAGTSMNPAVDHGQILLVYRAAYRSELPRRGDIVCIWTGRELVMKRIVGLPGESISISNGVVSINGSALTEPHVGFRGDWNVKPGTLSFNHYALLGDNRMLPLREHPIYVVDRQRIVGRVVGRNCGG